MEKGKPTAPRDLRAALDEDARMVRAMVAAQRFAPADVDDITQEVLIALDTRRTAFQVPPGRTRAGAWRAFAWRVVDRQVASFPRERARLRRGEQGVAEREEPIAPSREDEWIEHAPRTLLRRAVALLSPPRAAVMELYLADVGLSSAAARLEIPTNTAWTRLRAATEDVRATLRRWGAEREGARWS